MARSDTFLITSKLNEGCKWPREHDSFFAVVVHVCNLFFILFSVVVRSIYKQMQGHFPYSIMENPPTCLAHGSVFIGLNGHRFGGETHCMVL